MPFGLCHHVIRPGGWVRDFGWLGLRVWDGDGDVGEKSFALYKNKFKRLFGLRRRFGSVTFFL